MDSSTLCHIHQLSHAFNTSLPSHHSRLNVGCKIDLNICNSFLQSQNSRDLYPIIWIIINYETPISTPNLNLIWRGEESLYPKLISHLNFLQIPNIASPSKLQLEIFRLKNDVKFEHLLLNSSNTREWTPLNPPIGFYLSEHLPFKHLHQLSPTFYNYT